MIDKLSIIIPTLNEEKYLPRLLFSIASQEFKGDLQVIVVDGHSEDETVSVAKKFIPIINNLEIIQTERGISYQRNQGVKIAKYEYLLFLDADTVLSNNFLNIFVKKINTKERVIILTLILPDKFDLLDYISVLFAYLFFYIVCFSEPIVCGMFLFTTKENHEKINGFDEKVVYAEDIDYGIRSIKNGAKYHLFFRPHIYVSARRGKLMGRIKLSLTWIKWYLYTVKHGAIYDKNLYKYPYGQYT